MKKIYEATSLDAIDQLISKLEKEIVFLSFFSPTCGPCMMLEPILEEMVNEDKINIVRVNVFDYPELAKEYNVNAWPTNLIYKQGKLIDRIVGYQPKEEWENLINKI